MYRIHKFISGVRFLKIGFCVIFICVVFLFLIPYVHGHVLASSGWQVQELWHTAVQTPSQLGLIGADCDGQNSLTDLTFASGIVYGTFIYSGICNNQPPNLTWGFNAITGAEVWRQSNDTGWQAPLVSNGIAVIEYGSKWTFNVYLAAYDAVNNQIPQLWGGTGRVATIDNGVVYAQLGNNVNSGPEGSIYSYDLKSGQTKWQNTNKVCDSFQNPKIEVYNEIVYYIGCQNVDGSYSIQARGISDGSLLWSKNVSSSFSSVGLPGLVPSFNSTLISNGSIYAVTTTTDGSNNPTISSFSTTDGTQNWSKTLSDTPSHGCLTNDCTFIGQIIASGSIVYVLEDMNYNHDAFVLPSVDIYALDASSGSERWHKSISINANINILSNGGNNTYHGTLVNGVLYFNLGNGIYAFDAANGDQLMMDDTVTVNSGRHPISTPLIVGNTMYITGIDNSIQQFTIFAYKILNNIPTLTPTPTPPQRQIVFVHGLNNSFIDLQLCNGQGFQTLLCDNRIHSNVQYFPYYQDKGYHKLGGGCEPQPTLDINTSSLYAPPNTDINHAIDPNTCDSESSIAYNATGLNDFLSSVSLPISIINYSMGAAITRGWLTLAQSRNDSTLNKVDTLISIQGAQEGSYLGVAGEYLLNLPNWASILGQGIISFANSAWGANYNRPAVQDLIPQSAWYKSANISTIPSTMHTFNFYSDIQVTVKPQVFFVTPPSIGSVSFGDGLLLPGNSDPKTLPVFGGARFLPGLSQTADRHQFHLSSNHDVMLGDDILNNLVSSGFAVFDVVNDPSMHFNLNKHLTDNSYKINSCLVSQGQQTIQDEIIRILSNPANACTGGVGNL